MRTKYRFIEGYQGNDTVRGWRDFDSIYHAVFADMRGSGGYPKGEAYSTVPQGLLLRPAIPNDENFGLNEDSTYGPKANFKISLRELPDYGPFRVTITAAKYNDGLLLDPGAAPQNLPDSVIYRDPKTQPKRDDSKGRHLPGRHLPAGGKCSGRVAARRRPCRIMAAEWRCCRQPSRRRKVCRFSVWQGSIFHDRRRFRADPSYRCAERRRRRLHGSGLDSSHPTPQGGDCRAWRRG